MKYRIRRRSRRRYDIRVFLLLCILFPCAFFLAQIHFSQSGSESDKDSIPFTEDVTEDDTISLQRTATGEIETVALEDYVVGVVAAEMPVDFEEEALKAQAVIARTYALRKIADNSWEKDPSHGDLCDDPAHCQAYYDIDTLKASWGSTFEEKYQKISDAVTATQGLILTYDGEIARTYYHSTCGGRTASALEVWGTDYPYLQSVACKWDKDAPRYEETVEIALSELPWLLGDGTSPCIAVAQGEKVTQVPEAEGETQSGRVEAVSYAGLTFDATDFREALSLNSTNFTFKTDGDMLEVTTIGYGHGVGLCQYGANGMAADGYTYDEILFYYYEGTELTNLQEMD